VGISSRKYILRRKWKKFYVFDSEFSLVQKKIGDTNIDWFVARLGGLVKIAG